MIYFMMVRFPSMYAHGMFLKPAKVSYSFIHVMQKYKANVPKEIVKKEIGWFSIYLVEIDWQ